MIVTMVIIMSIVLIGIMLKVIILTIGIMEKLAN